MTKWMFSSIFYIVAPYINIFLEWMSKLGFLASFMGLIIAVQTHEWRIFWVCIGTSVICMALLLFMETIEFTVGMSQIRFMMQPYEGSLLVRIRNTLLGFAWFVALSVGSFFVFHLMNELEAGAFGILFFMVIGNLLGLGLMMKEGGAQVSEMLGDLFDRIKASLTFKRKPVADVANVVQMRLTKRG
jgi:hypothetical protein